MRGRSSGNTWTNWAGVESCSPRDLIRPRSRRELVETVAAGAGEGRQITVAGSGHSFTGAALTGDLMLDLGSLGGLIEADHASGRVKVGGGTVLADLNRELDRLGLAMPNLGDVDAQTIAGAISTGTHGTGADLPNISAQVVGMDLVTADGRVRELSVEGTPDELRAARVAVGSLGVIATVTLQTVPAFNLHRIDRPMPLEEVLGDFDEFAEANQHFEFFVFPYTDKALTIRRNRTDLPLNPRGRIERYVSDVVIENGLGELGLRYVGKVPRLIPKLARFSSVFMDQAERVDSSFKIFANYRTIRFNEMEYALPREAGPEAVSRVLELIESERFPMGMPIECRTVAGDDAMLSPAYERATTYVAVHQHASMEWRPYFDAIEEIFKSYGGRPHWGKRNSRTAADLAPDYPEWDRFQAVRNEFDPGRVFSNEYVTRVLGE
ncbi:MAG TPA: D-arabinono-1,4-lactone oxidase [Solirubrobacterales bacterium]|nr:D-arabinono-1,4-lactone oxidase [Solirubrobacterales bacterium]